MSLVPKKWFWYRIFGESLEDEAVPLNCAVNDNEILIVRKTRNH